MKSKLKLLKALMGITVNVKGSILTVFSYICCQSVIKQLFSDGG